MNIALGLTLFIIGIIAGSCFWVAMSDRTFLDKDKK